MSTIEELDERITALETLLRERGMVREEPTEAPSPPTLAFAEGDRVRVTHGGKNATGTIRYYRDHYYSILFDDPIAAKMETGRYRAESLERLPEEAPEPPSPAAALVERVARAIHVAAGDGGSMEDLVRWKRGVRCEQATASIRATVEGITEPTEGRVRALREEIQQHHYCLPEEDAEAMARAVLLALREEAGIGEEVTDGG